MLLNADEVFACAEDDECLAYVGFRDRAADYAFSLARFTDAEQDIGMVEVVVRDQVNSCTEHLSVVLEPTRLHATFDEATALRLLGEREVIVTFRTDKKTLGLMAQSLRSIFRGLPGLTIQDIA